jgi:hypothetical protein
MLRCYKEFASTWYLALKIAIYARVEELSRSAPQPFLVLVGIRLAPNLPLWAEQPSRIGSIAVIRARFTLNVELEDASWVRRICVVITHRMRFVVAFGRDLLALGLAATTNCLVDHGGVELPLVSFACAEAV